MKLLLVLLLGFIQLIGIAQSAESEEAMEQKSMTTPEMMEDKVTTAKYSPQIAFESYAPVDHDDYIYQGANIGLQYNYEFEDSQFVMVMEPNVSILTDEYKGSEEKIALVKWDHGVGYNYEVGKNMLLQPVAQAGIGYGWLDAEEDQRSLLLEVLAGVNLVPNNRVNIYAKGGYRFFDLNDIGAESTGELKGGFAMLGFGMRI